MIVWYCTDSQRDKCGPNPKNGPSGAYPPPPPAAPCGSDQYGSGPGGV